MPMPELPIEVCERIIDWIPDYGNLIIPMYAKESRDALYACCLVCKSWVPRCQFHLFFRVELSNSRQAQSFFDILAHSPSVSKGVKTLVISPSRPIPDETPKTPPAFYNWVYTALFTLPSLLTELWQLVFRELPTFHPNFIRLAPQFQSVRILFLNVSFGLSFREIVQLVNRFPELQVLQLWQCHWTQPAHCYPKKQHPLRVLCVVTGGDCRSDALNWMSSSRCLSALRSLIFYSVDTLHIAKLDCVLQQCTRNLRYLRVYFEDVSPALGRLIII